MLDTCPPYKHNASQARYNLTRFADSKYCGLSKLFLRQRWGKISGFARGRAGESFRSDMDPLFFIALLKTKKKPTFVAQKPILSAESEHDYENND